MKKEFVFIFFLTLIPVHCYTKNVNLLHLYFHEGIWTDKLLCNFSEEPLIIYQPQKSIPLDNKVILQFLLPNARILSSKTKQIINSLNNKNFNDYTIKITEITYAGKKGFILMITYNPATIEINGPTPYNYQRSGFMITLNKKNNLAKINYLTSLTRNSG